MINVKLQNSDKVEKQSILFLILSGGVFNSFITSPALAGQFVFIQLHQESKVWNNKRWWNVLCLYWDAGLMLLEDWVAFYICSLHAARMAVFSF